MKGRERGYEEREGSKRGRGEGKGTGDMKLYRNVNCIQKQLG